MYSNIVITKAYRIKTHKIHFISLLVLVYCAKTIVTAKQLITCGKKLPKKMKHLLFSVFIFEFSFNRPECVCVRALFSLWFALNRSLAQVSHSFVYFALVRRFFFVRLLSQYSSIVSDSCYGKSILLCILRASTAKIYSSTLLLLRLLLLFELPIFRLLALSLFNYAAGCFVHSLRVLSSYLRICEFFLSHLVSLFIRLGVYSNVQSSLSVTLLQHTLFCREAHTRSQNRHRTKEKKRQPNKRYRRKKNIFANCENEHASRSMSVSKMAKHIHSTEVVTSNETANLIYGFGHRE